MARPFHPPRLDHSNYTWRRVQITKLLVMQCSPPSRHFIPLRSKYSAEQPVLIHNSLCSFVNVRNQALHPYTTTGKMGLYVLIVTFLDSRKDDKRFGNERQQVDSIYKLGSNHPTSYPMSTGALFPGVKQPGREANHSSPSGPRSRKRGSIHPLPIRHYGVVLS
jgi:hypothetical protein